MAHTKNTEIKHALSLDEQYFGVYFVDRYNAAANTCYEFGECFFHECVKHHVQLDLNPVTKVHCEGCTTFL